MTQCFAYARVSTGEQAKGFLLDAQFSEIERYCDQRGYTIIEKFSDSMSGTKLTERPGLMGIVTKVDELKPEYIIATETDRISRNSFQFGWIDTHLSMKGTKILLVNERSETDPAGRAFQKIRVVFSEFENDLRQWRIKRGKALVLKEKRCMNRPPFGYRIQGKQLVINVEEAQSVKDIFSQYCAGVPVKHIARKYQKAPSNIRYILHNRFYIDPELNGYHKVLIDSKKFLNAQELLEKSRQHSNVTLNN